MASYSKPNGHPKDIEVLAERFLTHGLHTLAPLERVELLLGVIDPAAPPHVAHLLLDRFSNLARALNAGSVELDQLPGMSARALLGLKLIREANLLYTAEMAADQCDQSVVRERITAHWANAFHEARHEVFEVACLDAAGRLVPDGLQRISEGTIDQAIVYPRAVIETALKGGAAAILLAHNHTNGIREPSEQDKLVTRMIVLAAQTVGVKVVDHLVFGRGDVFSFAQNGLI